MTLGPNGGHDRLATAIDRDDFAQVKELVSADPSLHQAPMGYGGNGPLTRVAECRVASSPSPTRLEIATWLIDHGSDVHQGGDAPLMRAALHGARRPMMALLLARGADVNALYGGNYPVLFAPCETLDPDAMAFLLERGADPRRGRPGSPDGALDELLATYLREPERLAACVELLCAAGAETRHPAVVVELLRGRLDLVAARLDADPDLVHWTFPELGIGQTAYRRLDLRGATLLHVAAEFGLVAAAELLLRHGARLDARAQQGEAGATPLFHAASQFDDRGLAMTRWLVERGADPNLRARLPGHYERPDEMVEGPVYRYARLFPGTPARTLDLLRGAGAAE